MIKIEKNQPKVVSKLNMLYSKLTIQVGATSCGGYSKEAWMSSARFAAVRLCSAARA